jgi:hypothetical protein
MPDMGGVLEVTGRRTGGHRFIVGTGVAGLACSTC